jgi:hypothetical protein
VKDAACPISTKGGGARLPQQLLRHRELDLPEVYPQAEPNRLSQAGESAQLGVK